MDLRRCRAHWEKNQGPADRGRESPAALQSTQYCPFRSRPKLQKVLLPCRVPTHPHLPRVPASAAVGSGVCSSTANAGCFPVPKTAIHSCCPSDVAIRTTPNSSSYIYFRPLLYQGKLQL